MIKKVIILSTIVAAIVSTTLYGKNPQKSADMSKEFYSKLHTYNSSINKVTFSKTFSVQKNYTNFIVLRETAKLLHSNTLDFVEDMKYQTSTNTPLTGYQLDLIYKLLFSYNRVSMKYLELVETYSIKNIPRSEYLDINDPEQTTKNLLTLATYAELYKMFAQGFDALFDDAHIRRVVKDTFRTKYSGIEQLQKFGSMVYQVLKIENSEKLGKMLKSSIGNKKVIKLFSKNYKIVNLAKLMNNNNSYTRDLMNENYKFYSRHLVSDALVRALNISTDVLSGLFGNLIGAIRWRDGYLHENKKIHDDIKARLKPLDMILEKTPYILTDKFIPGNFGHIALWLGTEKQLKEIGMWNHPLIIPHHEEIKNGYNILEAVRPKVRLNKLENFLEIDEIAIIRLTDQITDPIELEGIYERGLSLLGKDYDFNFDVSTTSTVVCSELVYYALGHIKWPVERLLGRTTISPDNVASLLFYENSPVKLKYYIKAKKKSDIKVLSLIDMAETLGFDAIKDSDSPVGYSFDKEFTRCRRLKGSSFEAKSFIRRQKKNGYRFKVRKYSGNNHTKICLHKNVHYNYLH